MPCKLRFTFWLAVAFCERWLRCWSDEIDSSLHSTTEWSGQQTKVRQRKQFASCQFVAKSYSMATLYDTNVATSILRKLVLPAELFLLYNASFIAAAAFTEILQ